MNATINKPATAKAPAILCACGGQVRSEILFLRADGSRFMLAQTCQDCGRCKLGDVINGSV